MVSIDILFAFSKLPTNILFKSCPKFFHGNELPSPGYEQK